MTEHVLPPRPSGPSYQDAPPPPVAVTTSGFAIASLVLAIPAISLPLSIGFGIAALVRIRRTGQNGRGLAVAGLAVSGAWLLVVVAGVVLSLLGLKTASPADGFLNAHQGDCLISLDDQRTDLRTTSCDDPHDIEVFATVPLTGDAYPGEDTLRPLAQNACEAARKTYFTSTDPPAYVHPAAHYPGPSDWSANARTAVCTLESDHALAGRVVH
ncbi:DUF4190 domain-containing protein [Amycolatopsis saalfeldensis]|uniref:Septum formation n=1 Tax=Amycolatopsis saalfeldensis TaxID=394193 RepID=A0A1H8YL03_9PSEU|nr:DUF4190 domain-containing protein [Amycolatopsis saalfeldensis]SEP52837.1 Septum formation [Amycolatopsis saalfeldensis]